VSLGAYSEVGRLRKVIVHRPGLEHPSCWIFNGVTINPMTKPARQPETMIMEAIYRFHPMFSAGRAT